MKHSVLRPIFKKGSPKDPLNYRPVALLPPPSKILERHMAGHLDSFAIKHKILIDHQYDYREKIGAKDLVEDFANLVNNSLNDNMLVVVCFVDFTKAFDSLNNKILLEILDSKAVRGKPLELFTSYFADRT